MQRWLIIDICGRSKVDQVDRVCHRNLPQIPCKICIYGCLQVYLDYLYISNSERMWNMWNMWICGHRMNVTFINSIWVPQSIRIWTKTQNPAGHPHLSTISLGVTVLIHVCFQHFQHCQHQTPAHHGPWHKAGHGSQAATGSVIQR